MVRKVIAVLCCFSLVFTGPGMQAVFAQEQWVMTGQHVTHVGDRDYLTPNGFKLRSRADLKIVRKALKDLNVPQEEKDRALLTVDRLQPYLTDSQLRTPEVERAVESFMQKSRDSKENKDLLLMEFFDGLEAYAARMERLGNFEIPVRDDDNTRVVRTYNDLQGREVEEMTSRKINGQIRQFEIRKPNPDRGGQRELEAIGFIYTKDGKEVQKIVWSRRQGQVAQILYRAFYEKPDVEARIKDLKDQSKDVDSWWKGPLLHLWDSKGQLQKREQAEKLEKGLIAPGQKFALADMMKLVQDLDAVTKHPESIQTKDLTPEKIEEMSRLLEERQHKLQSFYAGERLENLQKEQLAALVQFFSQAAGLNYDPFNQKKTKEGAGSTEMKIEDIQKILEDFERGSYGGYGLVPGMLYKNIPGMTYKKLDPDKDMPPAMKDAANEAIRYLGYARDAQERMKDAEGAKHREEKTAALEELNRWIELAQVQLQNFSLYTQASYLQRLRDGTNIQEIRLRSSDKENDRAEAGRLMNTAQKQFLPKFRELENRTQEVQLKQLLASLDVGVQNARYANESRETLKEKLAVLLANVREMRAVYLARRFREYITPCSETVTTGCNDPVAVAKFRQDYLDYRKKERDSPAGRYRNQAEGGLYAYFLDHRDAETQRGYDAFDRVDALLSKIPKSDPANTREGLIPVEKALGGLYKLLGYKTAPSPHAVETEAARLGVFQSWLGQAIGQFEAHLQMFVGVNELDLSVEKHDTSSNAPEVRSRSRGGFLNRASYFFGLEWMNHYFNGGGWFKRRFGWVGPRDKMSNWLDAIFDSAGWRALGSPEAKGKRDDIRDLMRQERWEDARDEIAALDPDAEALEEKYAKLARMQDLEEKSLDIDPILTQGIDASGEAGAQGSLMSVRQKLSRYTKIHMVTSGLFDLAVTAVLGPAAAWGLAKTFAGAGWAIAKLVTVEKALQASKAVGTLGAVVTGARWALRIVNVPVQLIGRMLTKISENLTNAYKVAKFAEVFNRPGLYIDLVKHAFWYNLDKALMVGIASSGIQLGYHWISPKTSPFNSAWEVVEQGFPGGFAWGGKGAFMFAMLPPASAIQSENIIARMYKGYGKGTPAAGIIRNVIARPLSRWSVNARQIVKNPQGLWGWAEQRMMAIAEPGAQYLTKSTARFWANTAIRFAQHLDGYAKFMLVSAGAQEAAQGLVYRHYRRYGVPALDVGSKDDEDRSAEEDKYFLPSEHMRSLIAAHQMGTAAASLAYVLIPGGDFNSHEDMVKSREYRAARMSLLDKGGEKLNEYMALSIGGGKKMTVPIPRIYMLRRFVGLGKKEVELPATGEHKAMLADAMLRSGKWSLEELAAISMLPLEKMDEKGQLVAVHGMQFWSRAELRDIFEGKKPDAKAEWNTNKKKPVPADNDHIFLIPEVKDAAEKLLRERLVADPALAEQIKHADPVRGLKIGDLPTHDADVIRQIQERLAAGIWDTKNSKDVRSGRKEMRKIMREATAEHKNGLDPSDFIDVFNKQKGGAAKDPSVVEWQRRVNEKWDRLIEKQKENGEKGRDLAWTMERGREGILTDLLIEHVWDYANKKAGTLSKEGVKQEREKIVNAIENIIKNGGIINPRSRKPFPGFKPFPDFDKSPQKQALEAFTDAVLKGKGFEEAQKNATSVFYGKLKKLGGKKALKVFTFLQASGGKTLLAYVAFVPNEKVRAEAMPMFGTLVRKPRKVWFVTSNDHLARQFREDWTAYSGGRPPDFEVTSVDDMAFQDVFRKERKERSIGAEYHFVFDEADHPFGFPSRTVGKSSGKFGNYSADNPMSDVLLDMWIWAKDQVASLKKQGLSGEQIQDKLGVYWEERDDKSQVKQKVHDAAKEWRRKQNEVKDSNLPKPIKEETVENRKVIQQMFGRLYAGQRRSKGSPPMIEVIKKKVNERGYVDWLRDDGTESFLTDELRNYVKYFTLDDASRQIRKDLENWQVIPVDKASEVPMLSTDYRTAAELDLIWERRQRSQAGDKNLPPLRSLKVSLPLKDTGNTTHIETLERLANEGADLICTSGTCAEKVQKGMKDRLGMKEEDFANQEGKTELPLMRTQKIVRNGRVTVIDWMGGEVVGVRDGGDLSAELAGIRVEPQKGLENKSLQKYQLAVHMLREFMKDPGKKPLPILMPRSLNELKLLQKAIIAAKLTESVRIVRYFPDYVHRKTKEYELKNIDELVNDGALINGSADLVLLVPEIGGRGTDLNFEKYEGKIMVMGFDTHKVPVIEYIQALARTGPGRIENQSRVTYVDIIDGDNLLSDTSARDKNNKGYIPTLRDIMEKAGKGEASDSKVEETAIGKMKSILDDYKSREGEQALKEILKGPDSDKFKEFAVSGEVYAAMHPVLQEHAQNAAMESSGILEKPQSFTMTKEQVLGIATGALALAAFPLTWWTGHWWVGMAAGIPATLLKAKRKWDEKKKKQSSQGLATGDKQEPDSADSAPPADPAEPPFKPIQ